MVTGVSFNGCGLRFQPQTGTALFIGGNPVISYQRGNEQIVGLHPNEIQQKVEAPEIRMVCDLTIFVSG